MARTQLKCGNLSAWQTVQYNTWTFLEDKDVKMVFKTFAEISPYTIIDQASVRQEYIDQAQSLNLMIPPDMPVKEINALYMYAHGMGIKSLYYQYSMSQAQVLSRKKALQYGRRLCSL